MLKDSQQKLYEAFYDATHNNQHLDSRTELLVGLSAAIAMNCEPCTAYYLKNLKADGACKEEIQEVIAKVMAVAAGQKKLQTQRALKEFNIDLEKFNRNI